MVQFQPMNLPNLYNLAFGDTNAETGEVNDKIITDNSDTEKVLATVVPAVYAFVDAYPDAWVYATGSTEARTRLYRMGINKYFDAVQEDFLITGEHHSEWEWYEKGMSKCMMCYAVMTRREERSGKQSPCFGVMANEVKPSPDIEKADCAGDCFPLRSSRFAMTPLGLLYI